MSDYKVKDISLAEFDRQEILLAQDEMPALMVQGFGGTLTKLTKDQQDYISVNEDGPFKGDSYNY